LAPAAPTIFWFDRAQPPRSHLLRRNKTVASYNKKKTKQLIIPTLCRAFFILLYSRKGFYLRCFWFF
jgi:hypothetical protein